MKKTLLILFSIVFLMVTGCSGTNNDTTKEDATKDKTTAEQAPVKEVEPTATFKDGILETDQFTLKIKKTELIQSPMEENQGLFVTFDLTNKTTDEEIIPDDVLSYLTASQNNETSRVDVDPDYYFLDAFGSEDDTETYNKMVDLDNASSDALLPEKTIEVVEGYTLDNNSYDVIFEGVDPITMEPVGEYVVKLK